MGGLSRFLNPRSADGEDGEGRDLSDVEHPDYTPEEDPELRELASVVSWTWRASGRSWI